MKIKELIEMLSKYDGERDIDYTCDCQRTLSGITEWHPRNIVRDEKGQISYVEDTSITYLGLE
jgi:hypothetical protein